MSAHRPAYVALAALLVAAAALLVVELGLGATHYGSSKLADPCRPRAFAGSGLDATVQRVVLDGIDGAACRLGTSREQFVLSLASGAGYPPRRWNRHTIEVALRGEIPDFLATILRGAIRSAPLDQLIRGAVTLGNLFGG